MKDQFGPEYVKITKSTRLVLERSIRERKNPRAVGIAIAQERIETAMKKRANNK